MQKQQVEGVLQKIDPRNPRDPRKFLTHVIHAPTPPTSPRNPHNLADSPYKTDLPEANVRQIEQGVQDGPFTKNRVFPVTTLVLPKFCFSLRTSYKELVLLSKLEFCLRVLFPWSILKVGLSLLQKNLCYLLH